MLGFHRLVILFSCLVRLSTSYYDDYFLPESDDLQQTNRNRMSAPDYGDDTNRPSGYTCGLCIVVDEEFSQAYSVTEPTALKNSIQKFVDHASWVFRNVDWNGNGRPDNIGFRSMKISYGWKPYKRETKEHYETPKPAIQLLKIFARLNFSKCCLGIGFTNRPFTDGLDGISFAASDRLLGGICDHRNPHEEFMTNMNVVLVSGRGIEKSQLTSVQIAKALIHELGHAFGIPAHDNEYKDPLCWGFRNGESTKNSPPIDGRYIMWEKNSQSTLPSRLKKNTLRFSSCSKTTVKSIVSKRKVRQKCFDLDYNPFCGNGIIEGAEMCDCGNEYECLQQKCCGSRKSEKPCMYDTKLCGTMGAVRKMLLEKNGSTSRHAGKLSIFTIFVVFVVAIPKINN